MICDVNFSGQKEIKIKIMIKKKRSQTLLLQLLETSKFASTSIKYLKKHIFTLSFIVLCCTSTYEAQLN
jgi:hypothetical protein